jgi:hypothetical protein
MKLSISIILLLCCISVFSQNNFAGVYEQETVCCNCTLNLKPNYNFELNCKRHHQQPLIEKGIWNLSSDTIMIKSDTSVIKFLIVDDDKLTNRELTTDKYASLFWRQFISQKNYHDNWTISINKSWKYFSKLGIVKHGDWKYYNKLGVLQKIEVYRKGKLRRTKN